MALSQRDVQAIAQALMPLLGAAIQASVNEAVRRAVETIVPVPGTIVAVSGADATVEPDDEPGSFVEATITNASDQTTGTRTMVLTFGNGAAFCFGAIP